MERGDSQVLMKYAWEIDLWLFDILKIVYNFLGLFHNTWNII
jgi:hypothetical protein